MARQQIRQAKRSAALAAATTTAKPNKQFVMNVVEKSVSTTRADMAVRKTALDMARKAEEPKFYPLQNLLTEIMMDTHLFSQVQNRINKSVAASFLITDLNGTTNEEVTNALQNATWVTTLNREIVRSRFFGHSLIELYYDANQILQTRLIKRTNVDPRNGLFYPDYAEDKFIKYREIPEYGKWVLEFGEPYDLGILTNCIPHVLMKRFAQSCWSELCEIYGIPPRILKTNTQDASMLNRGKQMLQDMGAAAWMIIDETEEFQFAQGVSTNGDVYKNLIQLCNNENSMAIQGAVIGQDTANGNRSKEESSQDLLQDLVTSDLALLEQYWNSTVIPALQAIGAIPANVVFSYPKAEDLDKLWSMVKDALTNYDINPEWIKDTFGIPVEKKVTIEQPKTQGLHLSFGDGLFV